MPIDLSFGPGDYLIRLLGEETRDPIQFRIESKETTFLVLPPAE